MRLFRTVYEKKLLAALTQHGAAGPWVSALDAWQAFKHFGRTVKLEGDAGLLFQVGTYDFEGRPLFYFDPVCQFAPILPDGEHGGFEQIHCGLTCPPTPVLNGVATELWSFGFSDVDAFYAAVEALPEFAIAVGQDKYRLRVSHECV